MLTVADQGFDRLDAVLKRGRGNVAGDNVRHRGEEIALAVVIDRLFRRDSEAVDLILEALLWRLVHIGLQRAAQGGFLNDGARLTHDVGPLFAGDTARRRVVPRVVADQGRGSNKGSDREHSGETTLGAFLRTAVWAVFVRH